MHVIWAEEALGLAKLVKSEKSSVLIWQVRECLLEVMRDLLDEEHLDWEYYAEHSETEGRESKGGKEEEGQGSDGKESSRVDRRHNRSHATYHHLTDYHPMHPAASQYYLIYRHVLCHPATAVPMGIQPSQA